MRDLVPIYVSSEAKEAFERIAAFNPEKTKKQVASEIIMAEVKKYKGRKPPKASRKAVKTEK